MPIDLGAAIVPRWRGARLYWSGVAGPKPPVRFVILATARTGSELLVQLLDSHPDVYCASEVLHVPPRWPRALLEGHAVAAGHGGAQAFGCKVLVSHLTQVPDRYGGDQFLSRLRDEGWRIVLLERRDVIRQALSYLQAEVHGFHHTHPRSAAPIEVDPVQLLVVMSAFEDMSRWAEDAVEDLDPVRVTYEPDLESPDSHQATADRVLRELGLEPAPVHAALAKGADAWERVTNSEQVASVLSLTRYAHLLSAKP